MENTITQNIGTITQEKFNEDTKRWREEDILKLANHFHKLHFDGRSKEQFKRADKFVMDTGNDLERFKNKMSEITGIKMYLALEASDVHKHTFYIILGVTYEASSEEEYFKLSPPDVFGSFATEIVPETFKKMICENWEEIDNHLIDDLFIAKQGINRERVHYFHISDNIITYIKENMSQLNVTGITLYAGVDMNKFDKKEMISFTPVLGFKYENKKNENPKHVLGLHGVLESISNEVYFEYSKPCPPTCPPPA